MAGGILDYGAMVNQLNGGLLGNVVFDQFRKKGNDLGTIVDQGTSLARNPQVQLGIPGMPVGGATPKFNVSKGGAPGRYKIVEPLPNGGTVKYNVAKSPHGTLEIRDISFGTPGGYSYSGKSSDPNTGKSLKAFSDVFGSIQNIVSKLQPTELNWMAGGGNLSRFYNKMAPQMAQQLGGRLTKTGGDYRIEFGSGQVYPLKGR